MVLRASILYGNGECFLLVVLLLKFEAWVILIGLCNIKFIFVLKRRSCDQRYQMVQYHCYLYCWYFRCCCSCGYHDYHHHCYYRLIKLLLLLSLLLVSLLLYHYHDSNGYDNDNDSDNGNNNSNDSDNNNVMQS